MNGDRTIMVEILNAIEHGTLSVHETRRRLEDIIDKEIIRIDAPANMRLVEECEKLLQELNTGGKISITYHLAENESAVLMYTRKTRQVHIIKKYAFRIGAMAAAIFLVVIGTEILFHREWLSTSLSPDGEQLIISGETIDPSLVEDSYAAEAIQNNEIVITTNLDEALAFLNVNFHFPNKTIPNWELSYYECIKTKRKTRLLGYYTLSSDSKKTMIINATYFPDIQEAYLEFEQNEKGSTIEYQGNKIYIAENFDKNKYMWMTDSSIYSINGHVSPDEVKGIITLMSGG